MISNTASVEAMVDYDTKYYYNVRRPWIGSAEATAKLNQDGTLSEGSGKAESKTVQSLLDLVASTDLLSVKGRPSRADIALMPSGASVEFVQLQLSIKQEDFRHIRTAYLPDGSPCKVCNDGVKENYSAKIETPHHTSESEAAHDNSISFGGHVAFPKARGRESQP